MTDEPTRMHYTPAGWVPEATTALKGHVFDEKEKEALFEEVMRRLGEETASFLEHTVSKDSLLTEIVHSLAWNYGAFISGMYTDQWSAVTAQTGDGKVSVWAECYDLLAGAALAWKLIADNVEARAKGEE